jgi:mono/diheme cytochrome c family protein
MACHGVDGRGTLVRPAMPEIPDFTDRKWRSSRSDADLLHSILEGKGNFMLPMKSKVGTSGAKELVAYVSEFAKGKQVVAVQQPRKVEQTNIPPKDALPPRPAQKEIAPEEGSEISGASPPSETTERVHFAAAAYRQNCLTCHGADGRGADMRPTMPAIPDFISRDWQRKHTNAQLAASVHDGKGGLMPAFGDRMTANDIRDLVIYVRAFGPPVPAAATPRADEFDRQFQKLQEQWNQLERQIKELPPEKDKP